MMTSVRSPAHPSRSFLSTWRWRGWLAAILVQALVAGQLPIVGVLGYELALWAAVVASFAGLDLGAAYTRHRRRYVPEPRGGVLHLAAEAILLTWIPLLAWAGISAIRGLWTPTCDWGFGFFSFLAMPLAGGALAAASGVAIGLVVGSHRVLGTLAPIVVALGLVGVGLARFYAAPPVFSYSPLVGFFPGNLYDERIELGAALGWARLEAALWILSSLAAIACFLVPGALRWKRPVHFGRRQLATAGVALGAGLGAAVLHHHSGVLGYAVEARDIQRALAGRIETAHFVIHYADTVEIRRDIKLIADDHELRFAQVTAALGIAPHRKIHSYYFASGAQKAELMGARDVEMAKPWRREIYVEHRAFPHGSLRHEIAHIVAAEFGDPWFRVSARSVAGLPLLVNPGLIEGLAVAADWPGGYDREFTPHQATRAMQELGFTPSIDALLSLRFLSLSSARSYTTAGSFVRFLLERHGAKALRALYESGGDFSGSYGIPAATLQREWREMIEQIALRPEEIEATRERFRQVGVFSRPCPHAIASRRARAYEAVGRGDRAQGISLLREVCEDAPLEPRYRMELGDVLARGNDRDRREANELWGEIERSAQVTSSLRAEAMERLASDAAARGDRQGALTKILEALQLPLDDAQRRQLEAKRLSLEHVGPAGEMLRSYFFPPPGAPGDPRQWATRAAELEPELGLALYLRGLRQGDDASWKAMANDLAGALELGLPGRSFVRNAARRLAVSAYRAEDPARVQQAIETLDRADMTETDHLLAKDWRQRLQFAASGRLEVVPKAASSP
jgi:hypothetical protein